MGVWSATSTTAASSLQQERRQGTLELLVAAPTPFPLLHLADHPVDGHDRRLQPGRRRCCGAGSSSASRSPSRSPFVFVAAVLVTVRRRSACSASCWRSPRCATAPPGRSARALEMPVWLICGFLVPLSLLPDWVAADLLGARPDLGHGRDPAAAEGRNRAGRHLALCLALAAAYGVIGACWPGRLVDSARAHATLALT